MSQNLATTKIITTAVIVLIALLLPFLQTINVGAISAGNVASLSNARRTTNGLSAYTYNSTLASAARAKAQHMCTNDYWAHTAPDGTTGWDFMRNAGYGFAIAGENLAKGFSTDQAVVQGWMNSSGHRANILHGSYRETGVGYVACSGSVIVVAMYGSRSSAPAPKPKPAPQPAPKPAAAPQPAPKPQARDTQTAQNTKSANPKPVAQADEVKPAAKETKTKPTEKPENTQQKQQHPALTLLLQIMDRQQLSGSDYQNIFSFFNNPLVATR